MGDLMYCPLVPFSGDDFIVTSTRNIISRRCTIEKPSALEIPSGRCYIGHGVTIRADLAPVQIHKYTFIGEGTTLRPCSMGTRPVPLTIGPHCSVGQRCTVEAAVIGAGCTVDDGCTLSPRCILKDFVRVVAGTVVPPDMVCPPFRYACLDAHSTASSFPHIPQRHPPPTRQRHRRGTGAHRGQRTGRSGHTRAHKQGEPIQGTEARERSARSAGREQPEPAVAIAATVITGGAGEWRRCRICLECLVAVSQCTVHGLT